MNQKNINESGRTNKKPEMTADDLLKKLSTASPSPAKPRQTEQDNVINIEKSTEDSDSKLSIDDLLAKYLDKDTINEIYFGLDTENTESETKPEPSKTIEEPQSTNGDKSDFSLPSVINFNDSDTPMEQSADVPVPPEPVKSTQSKEKLFAKAADFTQNGDFDFLDEPDFAPDEDAVFDEEPATVKSATPAPVVKNTDDSLFDETTWDYGDTADGSSESDEPSLAIDDDDTKIFSTGSVDGTTANAVTVDKAKSEDSDKNGIFGDVFEDDEATENFAVDNISQNNDQHQGENTEEISDDNIYITEEAEKSENDSDVDDTDITLMMGLGMLDEENKKKIGADKVERVEKSIERSHKKSESAPAFEFTDRTQIKKIGDSYKYAQRSTKVKLIIAAIFAVLLLIFENITLIGKQFAGALDPTLYPVVYIMADLQLLLLCCAAAYDSILDGIGAIFKGKPTPESLTSLLVILSVINSIISASTVLTPYEPSLYNFPVALTVVMTLVFRLYSIRREIFSFNVISSKRPKYALHHLTPEESQQETKIFTEEGMTEENPDVLRIEKTSFIDGYFRRTGDSSSTSTVMTILLPVLVAVYALFFAFSFFLNKSDIAASSSVAYIAALFCFPLSAFFTYSIPFFKANKAAFELDSTIIGEGSLDEYSDAEIISFEDKNVFPSYNVRVQNINIYNNNYIEKVFYYASSVFMKTGGPLADVFEVATRELKNKADVNITENSKGYLAADIDDGSSVVFAKRDALIARGINPPSEVWDENEYSEDDVSVMYMLIDGSFAVKMYIKYIIDSDFEFILKQLRSNGMCVGIKTFDPNIDEEMIGKKVKMKKYPLRVIKSTVIDAPHDSEHSAVNDRSDSGIVSRSNTKSLLQTIALCDKVLHVQKTNLIIKALSIVIALIIAGLIMISGTVYDVKSLYIAVYQLFWLLPMMLTTRIFI